MTTTKILGIESNSSLSIQWGYQMPVCTVTSINKIAPINLDSIRDYLDAYDKKLEDNAVNLCKGTFAIFNCALMRTMTIISKVVEPK